VIKKCLVLSFVMAILLGTSLFAAVSRGERPYIDIYQVPDSAMVSGIIRVKLSEDYSHLSLSSRTLDGQLKRSGETEWDALCTQYGVSKINLLFDSPALATRHVDRHREWGFDRWLELEIDSKANIRDIVMEYRKLSDIVEFAEPEYKKVRYTDPNGFVPISLEELQRWSGNDPRLGEQWHYNNTGQVGGTAGKDISLFDAWNIEKGHQDIIVAVIDGGIQINHPDLAANIWSGVGYNFVTNSSTITADDHGTHVAGTIAAVNNNGTGVAGIAGGSSPTRGISLMSCQVFAGNSGGGFDVAPVWAADHGAAISQNSWGYENVNVFNQTDLDAIDYFNLHGGGTVLSGGLTIFAAGNDGSSGNWYPGCYNGAMAVAATNNKDVLSYYSNYDTWVEISAPGGETAYANDPKGVLSTISGNSYAFYQGTSMACPHVSGVAALVLSYAHRNNVSLTNTELRNLLKSTTDDHYAVNPTYTGKLGTGRLNAYAALQFFGSYAPANNLTAMPSDSQVNLSWTAPILGSPLSYNIFRNGGFLTNVSSFTTTYTDNDVTNGLEYSYYVTVVYAGGESAASNTATATPNIITEVIIGTGTSSNGTSAAGPINVYYQSLHGQSVYTAAELNALGVVGPINISQIGFNVTGLPTKAMPNYVVRMGHTSASNISSWISAGLTTVWTSVSYQPTTTGWNMLTLPTPFLWNGIDNIVIDTAFGVIGSWNSSGTTQYSTVSNGYRYTRSDSADQTNVFSGSGTQNASSNFRPNLKLLFAPLAPPPELTVPFVEGFESGADDWVIVNGTQTNKWHWGTATKNTGTHSLYVSNDSGTNNSYDETQASISHFYTDVNFPSTGQDFYLRFNWKANGQDATNDYLQIYLTEPTITPSAGTELSAGALVTGALSNSNTWQNFSTQLPANLAGSTKRLVFSWKNNSSTGTQAPAAIDNIRIVEAEQQDLAIIIGSDSEIALPPVSGPNSSIINASISIGGVSGPTVGYQSGYKSVTSPFTNAGLDIRLTADTFSEPYLIIEHNLGFIPPTIAYRLGGGDWNIVPKTVDWTASVADLTISTGKQKSSDLIIVFSDSQDGTLPVTLSSFTAVLTGHGYVRVDWATASETDVMGYYILRSESNELSGAETISSLIAAANTSNGAFYTFSDKNLTESSTYYYWLNNLDFSGTEGFYGPLAVYIDTFGEGPEAMIPVVTQALGNYPNPFNPATHLRYALAKAALVNVQIYNSRGQLVRTLSQQHAQPGYYNLIFDGKDASGRDLSSGVYLYRLKIGNYSTTNRILLLK